VPERILAVYSDYVCPFCYLAWSGISELIGAGWQVELRAFEVRPSPLPLTSQPDAARREAWEQVIAPRAAGLGLTAKFPAWQPRTRKAHELAHHCRKLRLAARVHERLFAAHFRDGLDIGRIDVLVQLGEELGLERSSVKVELDVDQYTDEVVREEEGALALGIHAVPAYVAGAGGKWVHVGLLEGAELGAWLAQARPGNENETGRLEHGT
jgi:predicted DsbA family dithiol-disulfide isomerase